jgi:hypothetical protein
MYKPIPKGFSKSYYDVTDEFDRHMAFMRRLAASLSESSRVMEVQDNLNYIQRRYHQILLDYVHGRAHSTQIDYLLGDLVAFADNTKLSVNRLLENSNMPLRPSERTSFETLVGTFPQLNILLDPTHLPSYSYNSNLNMGVVCSVSNCLNNSN